MTRSRFVMGTAYRFERRFGFGGLWIIRFLSALLGIDPLRAAQEESRRIGTKS